MQSSVRLKFIIQTVILYTSFPIKLANSARPPIADHNREIGSKWTYLQQLNYPGTFDNLYSSSARSTLATIKVTNKPPIHVEKPLPQSIRTPAAENSCGITKAKPLHSAIAYVIGGQPADPGEFPWFAAITKYQYNKNPQWKVVCGASLINSKYAITAAHCLHGRYIETLEVVFNLKDTANITHTASRGEIRRKIARFVIHPQYNSRSQHDDVALIEFKEPIDLRREKILAPICLPDSARSTYASTNGIFTGFGHTSYGSSSPNPKENSRHLLKVYLPILSHHECLNSKVPTKKNITENMLCAGAKGKDACINDSGGPLMAYEKGKAVLVGIASWGIGCALENYPGVFTRVSKYLSWIKMASAA